jgi:hypothetical protein
VALGFRSELSGAPARFRCKNMSYSAYKSLRETAQASRRQRRRRKNNGIGAGTKDVADDLRRRFRRKTVKLPVNSLAKTTHYWRALLSVAGAWTVFASMRSMPCSWRLGSLFFACPEAWNPCFTPEAWSPCFTPGKHFQGAPFFHKKGD